MHAAGTSFPPPGSASRRRALRLHRRALRLGRRAPSTPAGTAFPPAGTCVSAAGHLVSRSGTSFRPAGSVSPAGHSSRRWALRLRPPGIASRGGHFVDAGQGTSSRPAAERLARRALRLHGWAFRLGRGALGERGRALRLPRGARVYSPEAVEQTVIAERALRLHRRAASLHRRAPRRPRPGNWWPMSDEVVKNWFTCEAGPLFSLKCRVERFVEGLLHQPSHGQSPGEKHPARIAKTTKLNFRTINISFLKSNEK